MFGYGDTCPSDPDSVGLMEQLVMDHIGRLVHSIVSFILQNNFNFKIDPSSC